MLRAFCLKRSPVEGLDARLMHHSLARSHTTIHKIFPAFCTHKAHSVALYLYARFLGLTLATAASFLSGVLVVAPFADVVSIDLVFGLL
jgi:hypothetical protein